MSFMLTTQQIRDETKTVTRRLGWKFLKVGDRIQACVKCQGLGKGGKIQKLKVIEVVAVRREVLTCIHFYSGECEREGFPSMTTSEFVNMFCREMRCADSDFVTRIEFKYVKDETNDTRTP
jgi:hypothetical protein